MQFNNQEEDDGIPRITPLYIKNLLKQNQKLYYTTPELNDILYLHYKGFKKLEGLDAFYDLKVLYFEGNGINKIEGLDKLTKIRSLMLQENLISKIENLGNLTDLYNLNLTDNVLTTIEGLENNTKLQTLQLKRNKIGHYGLKDVEQLVKYQSLSSLDLSNNEIADEAILTEVFAKMPNLKVIYLTGNPISKTMLNYRKRFIYTLKHLKYLDDRPVFEDERRYCEAFERGGLEEERKERQKYKLEQEEKRMQNHLAFKQMIERAQREQRNNEEQQQMQEEEENKSINTETDSDSKDYSKLPTYNSQSQSQKSMSEVDQNESQQGEEKKIEIKSNFMKSNNESETVSQNDSLDQRNSELSLNQYVTEVPQSNETTNDQLSNYLDELE